MITDVKKSCPGSIKLCKKSFHDFKHLTYCSPSVFFFSPILASQDNVQLKRWVLVVLCELSIWKSYSSRPKHHQEVQENLYMNERAHHISLDRLPPEDCKSRQGFDQHIDESQFWDHPVQGHPPQTPSWYWGFNQLQKRCRRTRRHDKLLKVKLRKDKLRKDKLRKDKLQKDKLLTRQTPDETNSWWDKLLKIKSSEIQTPKYQILKKMFHNLYLI